MTLFEKKNYFYIFKSHTYFFLKNIIIFRIVLLHLNNYNFDSSFFLGTSSLDTYFATQNCKKLELLDNYTRIDVINFFENT